MAKKKGPEDDPKTTTTPAEGGAGLSRRDVFRGGLAGASLVAIGAIDPKSAIAADLGARGLVLRIPGLRNRIGTFFRELGASEAARHSFLHDPTGQILTHIFPDQAAGVAPQAVSHGNRLLYSALANDAFRRWAEGYQADLVADLQAGRLDPANLDRGKILQDVAQALGEHGDSNILYALLASGDNASPGPAQVRQIVAVEVAIIAIAVAFFHILITQIDFTPVIDPKEGPAAVSLSSSDLRNLSEELVRRAQKLAADGTLTAGGAV